EGGIHVCAPVAAVARREPGCERQEDSAEESLQSTRTLTRPWRHEPGPPSGPLQTRHEWSALREGRELTHCRHPTSVGYPWGRWPARCPSEPSLRSVTARGHRDFVGTLRRTAASIDDLTGST